MSFKPVIMYIDDSENNAYYFTNLVGDKYAYVTTTDPKHALYLLENKYTVDVIVCDQKMGNTLTGIEVLVAAKKLQPYAKRILITGYSEEKLVIDALKIAEVDDYIRKPCSDDSIVAVIDKAVEEYQKEKAKRIETDGERNELLHSKNMGEKWGEIQGKKIEELQKENKELKDQIKNVKKKS